MKTDLGVILESIALGLVGGVIALYIVIGVWG
jgi:hypothetical protein